MTETPNLPLPTPTTSRQQTAAFAGPPPLTTAESERAAGYDDLLARVTETLQPSDVLEHIWIRDIVDLAWEVFRLRRIKVEHLSAEAPDTRQHRFAFGDQVLKRESPVKSLA